MELDPFDIPKPPSLIFPAFNGSSPPARPIETEQPWHRVAAYLFASGASSKTVGEQLEKTPCTVSNLLHQPWFQEKVAKLMEEHGVKDIMTMFKAEQFNSLATLVEIRDNPKASSTARITCARDILDRVLGKPIQRIETSEEVHSSDPVAEVEKLEQEVNRLKDF